MLLLDSSRLYVMVGTIPYVFITSKKIVQSTLILPSIDSRPVHIYIYTQLKNTAIFTPGTVQYTR